MTGDALAA